MNLSNFSQIRYGGKDISLGKINGDIIYEKTYIPVDPDGRKLIMTYTTANTSDIHTFNSDFEYVSEIASNGDGTYTINLYSNDDFTSFTCNKNTLTVDYLAITSKVTDMSNMFQNCTKLTSLDLSSWDISNVTNMSYMFDSCSSLTSLDLSNFDTSNVTNMSYMFYYCYSLTSVDLSNFNTGNVTNMAYMFNSCNKLTSLDLSNFNTSKATNMGRMFDYCSSLTSLDLSNFDTSNVTNMSYMFSNCTSLKSINLEGWDLRKANTQTMLAGCSSLTDLNVKNWKCGDLLGCFINCSSLESINLSGWDTSETTSMQQLFYNCNRLKGINRDKKIDTSNVTNMYGLFAYTGFGSLDVITNILRNWDTSKVTNMAHMFEGCYWDTLGANRFEYINTNSVTDMSYMFANVQSNYGIYVETDTSNVTDMSYMFSGCGASVECYFYLNGDCSHMFENFTGSFNTLWGGTPTNASYMFASSNIDDIAFSSYIYFIDLQNCQNTSYMFYNCQNIYNLSFSDSTYHNMYNLYEAAYMFADCFNLTLIEIPYMSTNYLWNYENMFYNVPDYCNIKIDRSLFYLDEPSTGFSGYFQDY